MPANTVRSPLPRGFLPAIATIGLLAIPFAAMQFTDEVRWQLPDFVLMGTLLFGTGLAFELLRRGGPLLYRMAMGVALFLAAGGSRKTGGE